MMVVGGVSGLEIFVFCEAEGGRGEGGGEGEGLEGEGFGLGGVVGEEGGVGVAVEVG